MKLQIDKKEIEKIVNLYIMDKYPDVNLTWQDDLLVADITLLPTKEEEVTKEEHQESSPSSDNTVTGLFG